MKFFCAQCSSPLMLSSRRCDGCGAIWDNPVPAEDAPGFEGVGAFYWPPRQPTTNEVKGRQIMGAWSNIDSAKKVWGFAVFAILALIFAIGGEVNHIHALTGSTISEAAIPHSATSTPVAPQPSAPAAQSSTTPYYARQPQVEQVAEMVTCPTCHGTGLCSYCNGRGLLKNPGSGDWDTCFSCHGSGKCIICGGTGRVTRADLNAIESAPPPPPLTTIPTVAAPDPYRNLENDVNRQNGQ